MQGVNDNTWTFEILPMQKVAVTSNETLWNDFKAISPEEVRITKIANIARRATNQELSDEDIWTCRRVIYCCPCEFVIEDSIEARFLASIESRRVTMKTANICRRSGSQVVDEIMSIRNTKSEVGKLTCQKLHALYNNHLGDSQSDDGDDPSLNVSYEMIQTALTIKNRVKGVPVLNSILGEAEDTLMTQSPWFTLSNLGATINKNKDR